MKYHSWGFNTGNSRLTHTAVYRILKKYMFQWVIIWPSIIHFACLFVFLFVLGVFECFCFFSVLHCLFVSSFIRLFLRGCRCTLTTIIEMFQCMSAPTSHGEWKCHTLQFYIFLTRISIDFHDNRWNFLLRQSSANLFCTLSRRCCRTLKLTWISCCVNRARTFLYTFLSLLSYFKADMKSNLTSPYL